MVMADRGRTWRRWPCRGTPAVYCRRVDLGLYGRRAAVAAASDGLGLATARALVAEGARVVICGRDREKLDAAVASLGETATGIVCDVSTRSGASAFVDEATALLGAVDILVANGGGPKPGSFGSTTLDDYPAAIEANLLAIVAMCERAIPPMRERGWGRVLAITSLGVRQPIPGLILSNTARAGATAFLKTVAREVAADGVTVNSIQPGIHHTARITALYGDDTSAVAGSIPARTLGTAADFGAVAAFMCSEQARFVTGVQLHVDGGAYAALL